jgi:hypothetical protein
MGHRSFNDLTQYPVFPWIIADYTSNELGMLCEIDPTKLFVTCNWHEWQMLLTSTLLLFGLLVGYWLLVVGCWLLVVGCWLLVVGCWLLVVGCWLLVVLWDGLQQQIYQTPPHFVIFPSQLVRWIHNVLQNSSCDTTTCHRINPSSCMVHITRHPAMYCFISYDKVCQQSTKRLSVVVRKSVVRTRVCLFLNHPVSCNAP